MHLFPDYHGQARHHDDLDKHADQLTEDAREGQRPLGNHRDEHRKAEKARGVTLEVPPSLSQVVH